MKVLAIALVTIMVLTVSCAKKEEAEAPKPAEAEKQAEAPKVVQPVPPGNVRASHILISHKGAPKTGATRTQEEAKQLAEELLARVQAGEIFEDLAEAYSDCPSSARQGDLGFFGKGRMVKPFEDAAFGLEVGGISGIVETEFGYHIIKRTQ